MADLEMIKPRGVQNLIKKFCYTIGILPTSYKQSLTYEEQILAIGHYLETVVYPAINNNAKALTELQGLFVELKNYVDNYFDNLDVQEEINNKLDEMAESGDLQEIIAAYLDTKAVIGYDTISDMVNAENIENTTFARTMGANTLNDKGGALYKIRNITGSDIVDGYDKIEINNEKIAERIKEEEKINVYDTVNDLINSNNLKNGMYAETLGFYNRNDNGGALYYIRNVTNDDIVNDMDILEMQTDDNLIAELITDKNNVMCYGVEKNDINNNNNTIIEYVLNKMNYAYCKEIIDLHNELILTGQNKKFEFFKINYTSTTGSAITIHDTINYILNGTQLISNSHGIRLGLTSITSGVQVKIGRITAEKSSIYLGGSAGVLDSQFDVNRLEYKEHGIFLDLSQTWVGQIGFYNMVFADSTSSEITENFAVYGNCSSNPCTGLDFYNISLEGAKGGFKFETTDNLKFIEHLNIFGCRLAEFSLNRNYKAIKFITPATPNNIKIEGEFIFDEAYVESFDVSQMYALLDGGFKLNGILRTKKSAMNYNSSLLGKHAFIGFRNVIIDELFMSYEHYRATQETTLFASRNIVLLNQTNYANPVYNIKLTDNNFLLKGIFKLKAMVDCTVNLINNDGTIAKTYNMTQGLVLTIFSQYLRATNEVETMLSTQNEAIQSIL